MNFLSSIKELRDYISQEKCNKATDCDSPAAITVVSPFSLLSLTSYKVRYGINCSKFLSRWQSRWNRLPGTENAKFPINVFPLISVLEFTITRRTVLQFQFTVIAIGPPVNLQRFNRCNANAISTANRSTTFTVRLPFTLPVEIDYLYSLLVRLSFTISFVR